MKTRTKSQLLTRREALFAGSAVLLLGCPARAAAPTVSKKVLPIGDSSVTLNLYDFGPGAAYFAPHSDETTCVRAARSILPEHGGYLVELVTKSRTREVSFRDDGVRYRVDPNRIFTDDGIYRSLRSYGRYSPEAHAMVKALAQAILAEVWRKDPKLLIALHNNGKSVYSVRSYVTDPVHIRSSAKVHVDLSHEVSEFFFVTTDEWFEALWRSGFSVVLQSKTPMDDGSLSVYCGKNGVPYINIEAWQGLDAATRESQARLQARMIAAVLSRWKSA